METDRINVGSISSFQIFVMLCHGPNIVLVGSITFNFPPSGTVVILSTMISLRVRHGIDLTRRSIRAEVTDHHPIVKQPDEVINLITLDPGPPIHGSAPALWSGMGTLD